MWANPLVGTWRLVSVHTWRADGQITYPFGRDVVGYLIYTEQGHLSLSIMAANRPQIQSADMTAGTVAEKAAAYDTYLAYAGTYRLYADRVVHNLECSLIPQWVGTEQVRFLKFEGNRLTLRTAPLMRDGVETVSNLVWERI